MDLAVIGVREKGGNNIAHQFPIIDTQTKHIVTSITTLHQQSRDVQPNPDRSI